MKRILITGANKGIGFATVKKLLESFSDTFILLGSRDLPRGVVFLHNFQTNSFKKSRLSIFLGFFSTPGQSYYMVISGSLQGHYRVITGSLQDHHTLPRGRLDPIFKVRRFHLRKLDINTPNRRRKVRRTRFSQREMLQKPKKDSFFQK